MFQKGVFENSASVFFVVPHPTGLKHDTKFRIYAYIYNTNNNNNKNQMEWVKQ